MTSKLNLSFTSILIFLAFLSICSCNNKSNTTDCLGEIEYIKNDEYSINAMKDVYIKNNSENDRIKFTVKETDREYAWDTTKRAKIYDKYKESFNDRFITVEPGEEQHIGKTISVYIYYDNGIHTKYDEYDYVVVGCRDLTEEMEASGVKVRN